MITNQIVMENTGKITLDKEQIKGYFGKMQEEKRLNYTQHFLEVKIEGYAELGSLINAMLSVTADACEFQEGQNPDYGCAPIEIATVLSFTRSLIPFAELELLDKINEELKAELKPNKKAV